MTITTLDILGEEIRRTCVFSFSIITIFIVIGGSKIGTIFGLVKGAAAGHLIVGILLLWDLSFEWDKIRCQLATEHNKVVPTKHNGEWK
jgi:hypothetical protein